MYAILVFSRKLNLNKCYVLMETCCYLLPKSAIQITLNLASWCLLSLPVDFNVACFVEKVHKLP